MFCCLALFTGISSFLDYFCWGLWDFFFILEEIGFCWGSLDLLLLMIFLCFSWGVSDLDLDLDFDKEIDSDSLLLLLLFYFLGDYFFCSSGELDMLLDLDLEELFSDSLDSDLEDCDCDLLLESLFFYAFFNCFLAFFSSFFFFLFSFLASFLAFFRAFFSSFFYCLRVSNSSCFFTSLSYYFCNLFFSCSSKSIWK